MNTHFAPTFHLSERSEKLLARFHAQRSARFERAMTPYLVAALFLLVLFGLQ